MLTYPLHRPTEPANVIVEDEMKPDTKSAVMQRRWMGAAWDADISGLTGEERDEHMFYAGALDDFRDRAIDCGIMLAAGLVAGTIFGWFLG